MSQPSTMSNITNTHDLTYMNYIMSRFKRLDLTWTLTPSWNIRASVHPVQSGLAIHGPVRPYARFCDADSGDNCTGCIRAVEVQTPTHLRRGGRNDDIGRTLRHNS
ncbi:AC5 [Kenaf leaf curl virus-[India:Bahraich:2007]]|uniref:AC5 n=1 Tax=Kenaf leaf curl virus-[India:Bahraich:2007] TaxID=508750 RepID=B1PB93_9GEMI|nr:AC5 [Kenaf leaf curl virus-[India:Bahraich:2007]]ACA62838.1 AC5 [Kenaf leaf curl virus-[India:Bahraich:2007]]ACF42102.1 AC5 protein [Kenaf leaf curl virus-[India:Kaisarganj:2007]]ACF42109.1 AC5 protein [Kenaf leaf curl virus-[India:Bhangha:2007]]